MVRALDSGSIRRQQQQQQQLQLESKHRRGGVLLHNSSCGLRPYCSIGYVLGCPWFYYVNGITGKRLLDLELRSFELVFNICLARWWDCAAVVPPLLTAATPLAQPAGYNDSRIYTIF